jgi:hypothetical protein
MFIGEMAFPLCPFERTGDKAGSILIALALEWLKMRLKIKGKRFFYMLQGNLLQ